MKAYKRPSSLDTSASAGVDTPQTQDPTRGVGNAALAAQLGSGDHDAESGSIFDRIASWFRSLFETEPQDTQEQTEDGPSLDEVVDQVVDGPDKDTVVDQVVEEVVQGPESTEEVAEAPPEGIMRATSVKAGQFGALLGREVTEHEVKSGPGAEASVTSTLANGTPVTIVSVSGGSIEVTWNVGKEERTGWVDAGVFSPQPKLNTKDMDEGFTFAEQSGDAVDHSTEGRGDALSGEDVTQGGLADCFFIAAMNAVGNANGEFLKNAITFDESTGLYTARFYERAGFDPAKNQVIYRIHTEVVDGFLPTRTDGRLSYARPSGPSAWGPIYEKAYAQWQGGYDKIGAGGASGAAMTALTGQPSMPQSVSAMKDDEILAFFEQAKESGTAVVCGSLDSMDAEGQSALTGSDATKVETSEDGEQTRIAFEGPYAGQVTMPGERQSIKPGTVRVDDKGGQVSQARDTGRYPDTESSLTGSDVKEGEVVYKDRSITLTYNDGKGPDKAEDLEVAFKVRGLISSSLKVFAWHAYVFSDVKDGKIQLYNPWGSWQPEAMTPAEFKTYYRNVNSNSVPQVEASEGRS